MPRCSGAACSKTFTTTMMSKMPGTELSTKNQNRSSRRRRSRQLRRYFGSAHILHPKKRAEVESNGPASAVNDCEPADLRESDGCMPRTNAVADRKEVLRKWHVALLARRVLREMRLPSTVRTTAPPAREATTKPTCCKGWPSSAICRLPHDR